MIYVYPKFQGKDLIYVRLGGCGLGNLLFTYARAVVYAGKIGAKIIWPAWTGIMPKIIFSKNKDKRLYSNLFSSTLDYVSGISKAAILLSKKRVTEDVAKSLNDISSLDNHIIVIEGMDGCFGEIIYDYDIIYSNLLKILNKHQKKVLEYPFEKHIAIHVRLGDFIRGNEKELLSGQGNTSIPINWYVGILNTIRNIVSDNIPVYVYSDGTDEELKPLLNLKNVKHISFNSSIGDILAISRSTLFIASGSSFSMWARYLGRMSSISFPNQIKQKILTNEESQFEIELLKDIPYIYAKKIKELFEN